LKKIPARDVSNAVLLLEILESLEEGTAITRDMAASLMGLDMTTIGNGGVANMEFHDAKTTLQHLLAEKGDHRTVSGRSFRSEVNEGWCYRLTTDMNDPVSARNTVTRMLGNVGRAKTDLARFTSFTTDSDGRTAVGRNVRAIRTQLERLEQDINEALASHAELLDTTRSKDPETIAVFTTVGTVPLVTPKGTDV
jgi:hypothetical protein